MGQAQRQQALGRNARVAGGRSGLADTRSVGAPLATFAFTALTFA